MQINYKKNKPKSDRNPSNRRPQRSNNNSKKSTLNPNLLIQEATPEPINKAIIETKFSEMDLHEGIKVNIAKMGFENPTEIQDKSFENLVNGENLIGIANTGTGKTGAFLIPIIENLLRSDQKFQSLIIVPTRELALQVYDEFKKLSEGLKLRANCFIGGTNVEKDLRSLNNKFDFIIGTPGRLLDLKNRGGLKLGNYEVLVLDEFDKMLDMGFIKDIREIINAMRQRKQTLLFSATKDPKQQTIVNEIVKNPFVVEISSGDKSSKNVNQDIIKVQEGQDKYQLLLDLLKDEKFDKVILFTETKHLANRISKKLNGSGVKSDQIHGNKSQNYRINALDKFKSGAVRVLVATDVAARGIDVSDVALVINYQMPKDFDTYIHRVGRTGRAGKTGMAYTFVD